MAALGRVTRGASRAFRTTSGPTPGTSGPSSPGSAAVRPWRPSGRVGPGGPLFPAAPVPVRPPPPIPSLSVLVTQSPPIKCPVSVLSQFLGVSWFVLWFEPTPLPSDKSVGGGLYGSWYSRSVFHGVFSGRGQRVRVSSQTRWFSRSRGNTSQFYRVSECCRKNFFRRVALFPDNRRGFSVRKQRERRSVPVH